MHPDEPASFRVLHVVTQYLRGEPEVRLRDMVAALIDQGRSAPTLDLATWRTESIRPGYRTAVTSPGSDLLDDRAPVRELAPARRPARHQEVAA